MYRSRIATTIVLSAFLSLAAFSFASAATVAAPAPGTGSSGSGLGTQGLIKTSMQGSNTADLQCPAPVEKKTAYEPKEKPYPATFRLKNTDASVNIQVQNLYGKPCRDVRNNTEVVEGKCQSKEVCKATECYSTDCKLPDGKTSTAAQEPDPASKSTLENFKQSDPASRASAMGDDTKSLFEKAILGENFSGPMSPSYFSEFQAFDSNYTAWDGTAPNLDTPLDANGNAANFGGDSPQDNEVNPLDGNGNFGQIESLKPPQTGEMSMEIPDSPAPIGTPVSGFSPVPPDGFGSPLQQDGATENPWATQNPMLASGLDGNLPISKTDWTGQNPSLDPYLGAMKYLETGFVNPSDQLVTQFVSPDSSPAEIQTPADIASATVAPDFQIGPTAENTVPLATNLSGGWVDNIEQGKSNFGPVVSGAYDWWVNGTCTNIVCSVNIGDGSPYVEFGPTSARLAAQEAEREAQLDANGNAVSSSPPPPIIASGEAPMWVPTGELKDGNYTGFTQAEVGPDTSKEREGVISVKPIGETKFDVTAYLPCPSESACPIQGGRESARPGLDGERLVRTLDNYRRGESEYVTGASDLNKRMGQTYEIPSITYRSAIDGKLYTLENVPVYIHDTGSDFVGRPDKLDIATGFANSDAEAMRLASNQPFLNERYQTYTQFSGLPGSGSTDVAQTQPTNSAGSNELPYSSRPAGSYLDQQPLQNASYYGGDVVDTSTKMNGGWANNGSIADWNAGYAAVPPTFAAEHNGSIADWNTGFASAPATLATENNGSVGDWNAGYAAVPPTLANENNGTVADWNAGFGSVPGERTPVENPPLPTPRPEVVVNDVPLPTARPEITANTNVPLPQSRPEITVSGIPLPTARPDVPANEVPLPPSRPDIVENGIPLPTARPEGAPTAASVQEAAQQPPLERLANPDAKPWNSLEESSGNPYDSGGQKLVTLRCQGGGGVCGPDSESAAAGGTPLAGDMQGVAVPRDNPQGLKIGDTVSVQVGDKTVENVPITDYTRSGSNSYVASGGLERELSGTGRDAAVITRSDPEVPLPAPRPQDIDGNGNPIERTTPTITPEKETEKVIPIEERIPVPTWAPDPFKAEYAKAVEQQVLDEMSLKDRALLGYGQAPADQLNPAIPMETIIPDKNLAYLDDAAPSDLLVSHEQVAAEIASDQAARSFGNEVAAVVTSEAKEQDLSVADLSYLNQFEPSDLLLSNEQIAENIANDQVARSFASETGGEGELSQAAADNAPAKETTAATAIGEGETVPLPQSRPDVTGARVQEAVGNAHSALQDVRDNTDQLEKVVKNPNSTLNSFKSAGNDVLESLKDSKPVLQEAKQAALDAGDKKLADKIQTSINQVNTSIARINTARNQIQNGINEALSDPTRGWVGRAYIESVAMERLRSHPRLEAGLARLRGIWIRR